MSYLVVYYYWSNVFLNLCTWTSLCWFQEQNKDYDFKGGAGAACGRKQTLKQTGSDNIPQGISKTELHDDLSDSSNDLVHLEDQIILTSSRHSARTAKKSYK